METAGWKVGDVQDFLRLTDEEAAYVELKASLASRLRQIRAQKGLTQAIAAKIVGSSQSRLARMEAGDSSVSVDLLFRTLFRLGVALDEVLVSASRTKRQAKHKRAVKPEHRKRSAGTTSGARDVERRMRPGARI